MGHPVKYTKVNVVVDMAISQLIESLSGFTRLETFESCQGGNDEQSVVFFRYGNYWENPWRDISQFVFEVLNPKLTDMVKCGFLIQLEQNKFGDVFCCMSLDRNKIVEIARAVKKIADDSTY